MDELMLCEKKFWQHFMTALAALASIATLISFLCEWKPGNHPANFSIWLTLGILALCLFYAMIMMNEKTRISLSINPRFNIIIEKGDLFKKNGIIVIPVNEYFDTIVDDEIISPSSVHGKWINRYWESKIPELDRLIDSELSNLTPIGETDRAKGRRRQFDIGDCITIQVPNNNNLYVLFVLTKFDSDNHAYLEHTEFPKVIDMLMDYLEGMATDRRIYMPLFGTGLSRLNRSPQRILTFMLDALDFKHSGRSFPNGLFIELYSLNNINLTHIEELFLSNIHQD